VPACAQEPVVEWKVLDVDAQRGRVPSGVPACYPWERLAPADNIGLDW
jgi:hypothetical protein